MSAPLWWVEWRVPTSDIWNRATRPYATREAAEDAQRDLRHNGFAARIEESA